MKIKHLEADNEIGGYEYDLQYNYYCSKCGMQIDFEEQFCKYCGHNVMEVKTQKL